MSTNKNRSINLSTISPAAIHGIESYTKARAAWIESAKIEDEDRRKEETAAYRRLMQVAAFDVLATAGEKSARVDRENIAAQKGKTLPAPVSSIMSDAFAAMVTGGNADVVTKAYQDLFERLGVTASGKGLTRAVKFMAIAANGTRFKKDENGLVAASKVTANRAAMDALVALLERSGFEHDRVTGTLTRPEDVKVEETEATEE